MQWVGSDAIHGRGGADLDAFFGLANAGEAEPVQVHEGRGASAPVAELHEKVGTTRDRDGLGAPGEHSQGLGQAARAHHLANRNVHPYPPCRDRPRPVLSFVSNTDTGRAALAILGLAPSHSKDAGRDRCESQRDGAAL